MRPGEYCEGCVVYDDIHQVFERTCMNHNDDGRCPCSQCIIKPMCQLACEPFEKFRRTYWYTTEENDD